MLDTFFNWLVTSSANPDETAMTIKGILILQVPMIIDILGQFGINLNQNIFISDIGTAALVFGAGLGIIGIVRKTYLTIKGVVTPPVTPPAPPSDSGGE